MKKILAVIVVGVLAAGLAKAIDLVDVPNESGPAQTKICVNSNNVILEAFATEVASSNATITALNVARTCAGTTNGLSFTPRYVGDLLINTTSNLIWVATTATTNGWVVLSN